MMFDRPGRLMFQIDRTLRHLHSHTHGGEEPAIVVVTAHPAEVQVENLFDQSLHRLNRRAALSVNLAMWSRAHFFDHPFPCGRLVHAFAWAISALFSNARGIVQKHNRLIRVVDLDG